MFREQTLRGVVIHETANASEHPWMPREPSPLRKGAVIATRYSGDFDLTHAPNNQKVDYLAQIVK